MTPLALACKYCHDDIALALITHLDSKDVYSEKAESSPLHLLCQNKTEKCDLFKILFNKLMNKSSELIISCYYESKLSQEATVSTLKSILTTRNEKNETLIASLIKYSHANIFDYLLANCVVCVKACESTLIHLAARNGSIEILKSIVKHGLFSPKTNTGIGK